MVFCGCKCLKNQACLFLYRCVFFYIHIYVYVVVVIVVVIISIIIETWNNRWGYKSDRTKTNKGINPEPSIVNSILLLLRLGGSNRQPRADFLRGPCEQDNNVAAPHGSPSATDSPEIQFHTADGAAEPPVRITLGACELCVLAKLRSPLQDWAGRQGHSCSHSWPYVVIFMWLLLLACMWASRSFCVPPVILSCVTKNNISDNGCQKFKRLLMQKSEVSIY